MYLGYDTGDADRQRAYGSGERDVLVFSRWALVGGFGQLPYQVSAYDLINVYRDSSWQARVCRRHR